MTAPNWLALAENFEIPTYGLTVHCSASELRKHLYKKLNPDYLFRHPDYSYILITESSHNRCPTTNLAFAVVFAFVLLNIMLNILSNFVNFNYLS